jgi:hypothetical protein
MYVNAFLMGIFCTLFVELAVYYAKHEIVKRENRKRRIYNYGKNRSESI